MVDYGLEIMTNLRLFMRTTRIASISVVGLGVGLVLSACSASAAGFSVGDRVYEHPSGGRPN